MNDDLKVFQARQTIRRIRIAALGAAKRCRDHKNDSARRALASLAGKLALQSDHFDDKHVRMWLSAAVAKLCQAASGDIHTVYGSTMKASDHILQGMGLAV